MNLTTRIKVLIAHPTDPLGNKIGGIQTFLRNFVKYAPVNFEINWMGITSDRILRPIGKWQKVHIKDKEINFLPVLYVKNENKRTFIPLTLKFVISLLKYRIPQKNCVLDFHGIEGIFPFLFSKNKKVLFIHGHTQDFYNPHTEVKWKRLPKLYFFIEKCLIKKLDKIYIVREDAVDFYRREYPDIADRISFLPTWADNEIFYPYLKEVKDEKKKGFMKKYKFNFGDKLILFVGRFEGQKDPLLLVETFYFIASQIPTGKLLLVGSGGLKSKMEQMLSTYGINNKVIFLGTLSQAEVAEIMNIADVFLLTSAFEGMPRSVMEALACGLPVVTTDVGEVRRVVKDGICGKIIIERKPQLLGQAVLEILDDKKYKNAENIKDCVKNYSASGILQEAYRTFEEMFRHGASGLQ